MLHTHADAQRRRLRRVGKTRQSTPNVRARRLGQDEQYLTVREILSEANTLVPPQAGLSRERSYFYRFGYATLKVSFSIWSRRAPKAHSRDGAIWYAHPQTESVLLDCQGQQQPSPCQKMDAAPHLRD